MADYYALLSTLANLVSIPLQDLYLRVNVPLFTALVLGLIGSASPCQLTTNVSALAFISRQLRSPRAMLWDASAYLLGKITVYTLVGTLAVLIGLQLQAASIPVVQAARKVLGPLMIVFGLYFLGLIPLNFTVGGGLSDWIEARAKKGSALGAYLLGVAFSFAFCPTLFLLFFGLLIPLALGSRGGPVFPAVFALGTTLPLLFFVGVLATNAGLAGRYLQRVQGADGIVRRVAGVLFLLAGLNDTFVYWLL